VAKEGKSSVVPRLRFPEFRGAPLWTEARLDNLITVIVPPAKLQSTSYLSSGRFPIVDQSQQAISGWTDDATAVVKEPLPLIVFGDHTCALKLLQQPFAQGADGIKIFKAKAVVSTEYLFHSLSHRPLAMEDYKRHFSMLKERSVSYPDIKTGEQQKITDCLSSLDDAIESQGRKVEALKTYKRGLMQELFPREGETQPRLRFPEFRNGPEWREAKAGILFANRSERGEDSLPIYSVTMTEGLVRRTSLDRRIDDLAEATGNKKAYRYDIAYNMMRMWQGACGVACEECMVSPAYVVLSPQSGVHSPFYGYLFKLPEMMRLFTSHSRGLTEDRLRLYYQDFSSIPLPQPDIREQRKIASCLFALEARIATEAEKLDAFKTHREGLMQQLFPTPEEV
jgi:type I restriction enzyme S subunit